MKLPFESHQSIRLGAFWGFLGVGLGAFGAHALKTRLDPYFLQIFETGVRYQLYHALAMLLTGVLQNLSPEKTKLKWVSLFFNLGILLFSGSLYLLALTGIKAWGAVTPLGGLSFLLAWLLMALFSSKS
ncbi:DUF423 domain-containing protein [bacterium (Candidatus Blackallbacteria) CG17_big_fil_post_rev_8_21_14_2_50_48_46]|uniref:DUF423 domain-containing protein n=1 Tax=bacterium (Candidatus Blackallbacteria) CG17_big_fil_post_rev_8_21_14_2_50_48_46 TaxID=2014261 RepID=A0A2M7FY34_9BACT|nr:MAG: hypothetical protein COW64_07465 [bacterium (Candidatus Blackallbacteria) CG18_big_fil_WC_8_21_14_2_50_49_26]PIW14188.1 MAG: DUF423 domain-containing protein [bacterium (Candidatus Blackallbacteria) CG17_big_fil_post_rev_8_21_14_2_50_48_46]PIW46729.1 MAG: DUF423 domain-containing protein [bacterium (Candidatus Blackallbacteria) CG13_big_fil_rev_8_21_14_2_50_49_14]